MKKVKPPIVIDEDKLQKYSDKKLRNAIKYILNKRLMGEPKYFMEEKLSNLKTERQQRKPKRKWKNYRKNYPTEFYDIKLRKDIRNKQDGNCILKSNDCKGVMTFHHVDKNKNNNHMSNLVYICIRHHFGVHNGIVALFNQV